ncbi:MAG: protoheme farnesyltransferase [Paenibacillaceae bacterium]|jgi:protoheme IX farnesyltransferase|nr:protoheme farnesyltransferase [Paenibacillaceae bacterium]
MDKSITYTAAADSADPATPDAVAQSKQVSWRDFVYLAKPGIIFSNLIAAFGGFWVAAGLQVDWMLLIWMIVGTTLVMASSCVLNNYIDRDMDTKMTRTQKRPLPSGRVDPRVVMWYGIVLGLAGIAVLDLLVNPLCALLGLVGMFVYVWVYSVWLKRTSVWSTVIGAISGSMPPVIGYCAVSQTLDAGAWILFLILFLWQPPHFWALGIRRTEEYRNAGFPLLPVVRGAEVTKVSMLRYVIPLVPASLLMYIYGYVGEIYLFVAAAMGLYWAYLCLSGFRAKDDVLWAKKNFMFSINYLTILFLVMILDTVPK